MGTAWNFISKCIQFENFDKKMLLTTLTLINYSNSKETRSLVELLEGRKMGNNKIWVYDIIVALVNHMTLIFVFSHKLSILFLLFQEMIQFWV